jgi:hypothetical protein
VGFLQFANFDPPQNSEIATMSNLSRSNPKSLLEQEVDRQFKSCVGPYGSLQTNPVTGGHWVLGEDDIDLQKKEACRHLLAREWLRHVGPPDAPLLPVSHCDIEQQRSDPHADGLTRLWAWFARSLSASGYDLLNHPSFEDYARTVLASSEAPRALRSDQRLCRRYPPAVRCKLGPGLIYRGTESSSQSSSHLHCANFVGAK